MAVVINPNWQVQVIDKIRSSGREDEEINRWIHILESPQFAVQTLDDLRAIAFNTDLLRNGGLSAIAIVCIRTAVRELA